MKIIDFKVSGYFSMTFLILGGILVFFGLIALLESLWLLGLLLWLVSLLIFTTHYRLRIDVETKTFHDYLWVLGMKHGEKGKFDAVEYLFIKKAKVSQTMSVKVASTTIEKDVYDGYLKFSDGNKIHLLTKDSKVALQKRLNVIAEKLQTKITDYTEGAPKILE